MSKKWIVLIAIILIILIAAIILVSCLNTGKDLEPPGELLGRWDATGGFIQPEAEEKLVLQINEVVAAEEGANTFLGTGCMQTESSGGWAPLSLQAVYDPDTANYTVNMLSTLISPNLEEGAAVVRMVGTAEMGASGIRNDQLNGSAYLRGGEVAWNSVHTSLEMVECPALDAALSFLGEFGLHRDLAYIPAFDVTNFHGETNIVSLQMRAEAPDGTAYLADYHTDIFSPDVNFIDQFRFDTHVVGTPPAGQPYHFALLDGLGELIPGGEDDDTFRRCDQGAATNIRGVFRLENHLELTWDAPEIIPGYFDPENGYGSYQLVLEHNPWMESGMLYGAETITALHHAPWNSFEPGAAGSPDGNDYGISLSELEDGQYILFVGTFSYYEPPEGESGCDCRVQDSRHALFIYKQGNEITVQPAGAISGFVTDSAGNPLANIAVKVDGLNTGFHEGVCSGENGYYVFTRLPLDSFTLSAGGFGGEDCPENSFAPTTQPDIVVDLSNPVRERMDIALNP